MKEDKRKYPRLKNGVKVVYKVMGIGGECDLDVLELSAGGLRLPVGEKIGEGTLLELNLIMPKDREPFFALARVAWQSPEPFYGKRGNVYYETGIEFLKLGLKERMYLIRYVYDKLKDRKRE